MAQPPILNQDSSKLVSLRRVSGAGLANVSYLVIQSLLFVVMTPLVLKALGPKLYGLWTILAAITGFASLGNFGIGAGVTKYVSEFSVGENAGADISGVVSFSFLFILLTGLLTGMLLFLLRHWIAAKMARQAGEAMPLASALVIIAFGITIVFLIQLPKSILFGLVHHKVVGAIDVAQSVTILGAALIIGLNGGGIVALALSLVLINLAFLLILSVVALQVTRSFVLHFTLNRGLARKMLRYSLFAWIAGLGSMLFSQADRVLVGIFLGPAAAGAYSICTGVAARLNSLASSATLVLVPFASSYQAQGKNPEVAKAYLHLLRLIGCLLAAIGIVLIFWSNHILSIWISPQFAHSYGRVFEILILAYALFSMIAPGYYISFGLGSPAMPALVNICGALLMLTLISLLSPPLGLTGAALANISCSLELALLFVTAKQLSLQKLTSVLRAIVPPAAILLITILIVYFYNFPISINLSINLSLLILLTWFGLNNGRLAIVLKAIKK